MNSQRIDTAGSAYRAGQAPRRAGARQLWAGAALCLCLCLVVALCPGRALADEPGTPDMSATGSINIAMAEADGTPVGGGTMRACKVADLHDNEGALYYTLTDAFAECPVNVTGITAELDDAGLETLAMTLAAYAEDADVVGQLALVDSAGDAHFDDLSLGLYLITQVQAADGYLAVSPFLATVPLRMQDHWAYTVDAEPKMEPVAALARSAEPIARASGGKLAQTGDLIGRWVGAHLIWIVAGCAACAAVAAICLIRGHRAQRRL